MTLERVATTQLEPKRSGDKVPVQHDWHDYLANQWAEGSSFPQGSRIRGSRKLSTGLEYQATTGGVSGRRRPIFPTTLGATVLDGSVVWTATAITQASLRATIVTSTFPAVNGLTLSDQSDHDLVHTIYVAGGTSGQEYTVVNAVVLSNSPGEIKESAGILPVVD